MGQTTGNLFVFKSNVVTVATNRFKDVPTILQFEDTPLIEVVRNQKAGFTTRFRIFNQDGIDIARVVGSRLFPTEAGLKTGIKLEYPDKMTVCKIGSQVLFEVRRDQAAGCKAAAELYTPEGRLVRAAPATEDWLRGSGPMVIGGLTFQGNTFTGFKIAILLKKDGSARIGVNSLIDLPPPGLIL